MTVWGKKKEQIAGLIGSVFNNMNINSDKDAPSINAVKSYVPPKDNLLDNADFKSGIINQKGQSSYSVVGSYGIDRWYSSYQDLTVGNGYIDIANNHESEYGFFTQHCKFDNEKYTLAVYVENVVGTIYARINGDDTYDEILIKNGLNILSAERSISNIHLKLFVGASVRIRYIKLERGSYFTGMPVWNETQELLKCQSRYIMIKSTNVSLSLNEIRISNTNSARLIFKTNSTINKAPMIKFSNIFVVQFNDGAYRQVSQVSSVNYSRGYILIDFRTIEETLNLNEPCYLFINTNGYLEIDMNDY